MKGTIINEALANKFRLQYSIENYVFDDNKIIIVPEDETHDYLLRNFPIDKVVLDFYYSHTNRFFSDKEYRKMTECGYVGKKEHTMRPYPIIIYGAYFNRIDLVTKLEELSWQDIDDRPILNGKKVEYFDDLLPYFKEYSEGFKEGYGTFEEKHINKYLPSFPDKFDFINKVFEFVTKRIFFDHDWFNNHSSFHIKNIGDGKKIGKGGEIINAFIDGQKQGYFYKAWKIILSNNEMFKPLFEECYFSPELGKTEILRTEPQQNNQFSILEWATIFYYANETKLLPENRFIKERIKQFMNTHNIATTFDTFKSKYHTAKNRINKNNNYPINKLELIIPFLKEHYNQTVTKVENDIIILDSEKSEYQ